MAQRIGEPAIRPQSAIRAVEVQDGVLGWTDNMEVEAVGADDVIWIDPIKHRCSVSRQWLSVVRWVEAA